MVVYCRYCQEVTPHRVKGTRVQLNVCDRCDATNLLITLVKSNGETHYGKQVRFVEWESKELGSRYKQIHDEPQVGFSVIVDPQYLQFTWLTTPIVEIEDDTIDVGIRCITFKTEKSSYKLYISIDREEALKNMMRKDEESGLYQTDKDG